MTDERAERYSRSARLYDLIYAFKGFEDTGERLRELIRNRAPNASSILDVGCGTGQHLQMLGDLERVGLDLSEEMLAVAAERCPDVELHQGDMASFALDRTFDVVISLFNAIGYVETPDRLRSAISAMADHTDPGGLVLVEPWLHPNRYWEGHVSLNTATSDDLKVAWMYTQVREGDVSRFDIHYLVGGGDGVEHFVEVHSMGLFTDEQYRDAFTAAGLQVEHDPTGLFGRGLYLGRKG